MINIGIIGANGYTGEQLMRILSTHPEANLKMLVSRSLYGTKVIDIYPHLIACKNYVFDDLDITELSKMDLVFSCLPHSASAETCSILYNNGVKIIDLSADFRYKDLSLYEKTYKVKHPAPHLLAKAVYGLPEINRNSIEKSQIVGNPGCYTTSAILPLYPLLKERIINSSGIIIDSKSGTSGAGRKPEIDLLFTEIHDDFKAYSVTTHRHTSEIEEVLSLNCNQNITLCFTPHLLPISRGILSTIYAPLVKDITENDIYTIYDTYYKDEPFVHISNELPHIKWATGSNNNFIGFKIDIKNKILIIISVLDNLIKGASGQAVQNMNIMFGLNETMGLI